MTNTQNPRNYVKELGYTESEHKGLVSCDHCGELHQQAGDIMRGHRRRCSVKSWNAYTPARCWS